jgi:hypothetical protein
MVNTQPAEERLAGGETAGQSTVTNSARHAVDRIANDPVEIAQGHDGKPVAHANIPAPAIARRLTSKFRPNDRDDVAPLSQVRGGADANSATAKTSGAQFREHAAGHLGPHLLCLDRR